LQIDDICYYDFSKETFQYTNNTLIPTFFMAPPWRGFFGGLVQDGVLNPRQPAPPPLDPG